MRRRLRALALRGLNLAGLEPRIAADVAADLRASGPRLAAVTAASLAAPLLEVAFISLLYALIATDRRADAIGWIHRLGLGGAYEALGGDGRFVPIVAGAAAVLLAAVMAVKYAFGYLHAAFLYESFIQQVRRVVSAFLLASPSRAMGLERSRVAAAATGEALHYGRVVFALLNVVSSGAAALFFVGAALLLAPALVLLGLVVAALTVVAVRRGYRVQKILGTRRVAALAALTQQLWEILNGYRTLKIEGGEERRLRAFWTDLRDRQVWRLHKTRNELAITLGAEGLVYAALLGMVVLATTALAVDASLVLVFLVLMGRLQKYLSQIQLAWVEIQHSLPSLTAVADIVAECRASAPPPRADRAPAAAARPFHVVFDRVTFGYREDRRVLDGVRLALRPGDRALVQGPSGEGKSTLLYLACGLLHPDEGAVTVDGAPLTDDRFYAIRSSISYAAPDVYLFRGSIRENLCLGADYPDEAVADAVQRARLGPVVARLPGGLDADIGEDGGQLSLGERQRVMLARIFLKRPLLVLLDEATANLDVETEHAVLSDLFANLAPEAIVLMVTHRAPVGIPFTRRFRLADGRLRELTAVPA